jgi:hypothetical protein
MAASGTTSVAADLRFKTSQPPMLTAVKSGVTIEPLLTVGDDVGSYQFESIPDGISVRPLPGGLVELYVNHETSKVPFPYNPLQWTTDPGESQSDFDNAQVSKLTLDAATADVLSGSFAITTTGGFQRFCSNYLATSKEGFTKDILFTNEESPDYVLRTTNSWPPAVGDPNEEENGVVVALDVATGQYQTIYGMGRHNHENDVAIPGFDKLVVLSGDDTFTSGPLTDPLSTTTPPAALAPAQSQLYSYTAGNTKNPARRQGRPVGVRLGRPGLQRLLRLHPGLDPSVSGHFIKVPRNIATGKEQGRIRDHLCRRRLSRRRRTTAAGSGIFGPDRAGSASTGLSGCSSTGATPTTCSDFVRVEDIAYDKRPAWQNVVYVADTGRGTGGASQAGRSTNGRVWKMVLEPDDPRKVDSLSVFVEGDDNEVKTLGEIHQPDNLETTQTGILVTEDPGSGNQFTPAQQVSDVARATTARLWYLPFSGTPEVVVKLDQTTDETPGDVDPPDNAPFVGGSFPISPGNWGAWESSGIVDASAAFGPGAYLIDVQAHTYWVESAPGPDTSLDANTDPDFTYKREGGQLLLIRIPGI